MFTGAVDQACFSESKGESRKLLGKYASTKTQADLDEALALDPEVEAVWHEMGDEMTDDFRDVSSAMDSLKAKAKASRARSSHTQVAQSAKFGLRMWRPATQPPRFLHTFLICTIAHLPYKTYKDKSLYF